MDLCHVYIYMSRPAKHPSISKNGSKIVSEDVSKLNNRPERDVTLNARDARATRGSVQKFVNEDEALLQLIEMVVMYRRGKRIFVPITVASVKGLKKLLGLESLATKEGEIYWKFPDELRINLERVGIDVETGICVDQEAFRIGLKGLEQKEAKRLGEKYEGQDYEARRAAFREVMQRWRPTKAPKVASAQHYLANQVLNERIAKELRKEAESS